MFEKKEKQTLFSFRCLLHKKTDSVLHFFKLSQTSLVEVKRFFFRKLISTERALIILNRP